MQNTSPPSFAAGDRYPRAVLFDLLTALLDSWTVWNSAAGSEPAGRAWRAEYLRLTYGCGAYMPYEELVRQAAENVGLPASAPQALEDQWDTLPVWSGARRLGIAWDAVITSEEAGFYKPDPRPYQLALQRLEVRAEDAAFVAGSGYDMFGTASVGLRTYWHNRVGLARPEGAPLAEVESPTLEPALPWLRTFQA